MEGFEFDERKSRINLLKHGIDFIEAQAIWRDENLAEIPARFDGEERSIVIGKYEERDKKDLKSELDGF